MKMYTAVEIWEILKTNLPFTITLLTLILTCVNWSIIKYKNYKQLKKYVDILPSVNPQLTKQVKKNQEMLKNIESKINNLNAENSYNKKNIIDIKNEVQKLNNRVDNTASIQSFLVETVYFHLIDFYKMESLNRQDYIRLIDILDKAMEVYRDNKGLMLIRNQLECIYEKTIQRSKK